MHQSALCGRSCSWWKWLHVNLSWFQPKFSETKFKALWLWSVKPKQGFKQCSANSPQNLIQSDYPECSGADAQSSLLILSLTPWSIWIFLPFRLQDNVLISAFTRKKKWCCREHLWEYEPQRCQYLNSGNFRLILKEFLLWKVQVCKCWGLFCALEGVMEF